MSGRRAGRGPGPGRANMALQRPVCWPNIAKSGRLPRFCELSNIFFRLALMVLDFGRVINLVNLKPNLTWISADSR